MISLTDAEVISAILDRCTPRRIEKLHRSGKPRRHSIAYLLAKRWGIVK